MNEIIKIEHNNERVLTTEQLAQVYGCDSRQIKQNFNNNADRFVEGNHYFKLEGDELQKLRVENIDLQISPMTRCLYLWTRRGASRHCKMLGTDQAWDMFDQLEETYFTRKEVIPELSPQLQVLINIEMQQKEQAKQIAHANKRIDGMQEVISLSPESWRTDTTTLLNKMVDKAGNKSLFPDFRNESYRILDKRMGVSVETRLTNMRRRMLESGCSKTAIQKANVLDVIGQDKKLIEGYMAIIKEMAIKYGVAEQGLY